MARRKRPPLPSLQSNPPAKRCWDGHSEKWNGPYPLARPIRVEGMSHEDAHAEQGTSCRDDLAHSFPPCLTGESSTGSFPDDFAELGKWFRRPGRRSAMSYWQGGLAFRSPKGPAGSRRRVFLSQGPDSRSTVGIGFSEGGHAESGNVEWVNSQKGYGVIPSGT